MYTIYNNSIVVCRKATHEVIACVPLDGSEGMVRRNVGIKVYNGTEPILIEKDGYVAVDTNAFLIDLGKGD